MVSDFPPFTSAFALASGDAHVQALAEDAVLSARMTFVGSGVPSVTGLASTPRPSANTSFAPPRIASLASVAHASTGAGGP